MHFSDNECARSIYLLISPLQCSVFLHDTVILYMTLQKSRIFKLQGRILEFEVLYSFRIFLPEPKALLTFYLFLNIQAANKIKSILAIIIF